MKRTGRYPFADENVALGVEAGVVRVDEFAIRPLVGVLADFAFHYLFTPRFVLAEVGDDFVLAIEQRDAGLEIGHEH